MSSKRNMNDCFCPGYPTHSLFSRDARGSHQSFAVYIRRLALCRQMEIWGITSNDLFSRAVKAHPHAVESHNGMINTELVPHPEKGGLYIVGKKPISYYRKHRIRKFSAEAVAICDRLSRQMANKGE